MLEPALITGIDKVKNVGHYSIGSGVVNNIGKELSIRKKITNHPVLFFIDSYFFEKEAFLKKLYIQASDLVLFVNTSKEPTTKSIDSLIRDIIETGNTKTVGNEEVEICPTGESIAS